MLRRVSSESCAGGPAETAVGLEAMQKDAFCSACLEHETETRSLPATRSKADREVVSEAEAQMKHVLTPSQEVGRRFDETRAKVDAKKEKQPGTGPMKRNSQGWETGPMKKSVANCRQERAVSTCSSGKVCVPIGRGLIVRAMEKDASENLMRVIKVEKLVVDVRDGESGDRTFRAEKVLQQVERTRIRPHKKKSRKSGGRGWKSPDDDEVVSSLRKAINRCLHEKAHQGGERFHEYDVLNIQMIVERQCRRSRRSRRLLRYTSCSSRIRWWMCS